MATINCGVQGYTGNQEFTNNSNSVTYTNNNDVSFNFFVCGCSFLNDGQQVLSLYLLAQFEVPGTFFFSSYSHCLSRESNDTVGQKLFTFVKPSSSLFYVSDRYHTVTAVVKKKKGACVSVARPVTNVRILLVMLP